MTVKPANTTWREYATDGVPGSGVHNPIKADIRSLISYLESLTQAAGYGNSVWFATKALLDADLAHDAGTPAFVYADATSANNGIYIKAGASGAGSWGQIITYLPGHQFVVATNTGAGTANAIVATSSPRVTYTDGVQIIRLNIAATNTSSSVTVAFDGGAALAIKTSSNNNPAIGGLVTGSTVLGVVDQSATVFRLLSDQASAAIQTAAEAAQGAAEEWAQRAEDSPIPVSAGGDGSTEFSSLHHASKSSQSAAAASVSAAAALTSEGAAATSESNASTSETNAAGSALAAATSASNASTSETNAAGSASAALASETAAATSAGQAATSAGAAAAAFDDFDAAYLGSKTSDPATDNDGQPLQDGAIYWNSVAKAVRFYDLATGTWANISTGELPAESLAGYLVPVGTTLPWGFSTAPVGWILKYGQALLKADYPLLDALYAADSYPNGHTGTHFTVDDDRGYAFAGRDNMGGVAAGRLVHQIAGTSLRAVGGLERVSLTLAQMPAHSHNQQGTFNTNNTGAHTHPFSATNASGGSTMTRALGGTSIHRGYPNTQSAGAHAHTVTISGATTSAGSGNAHQNLQPTKIYNWIQFADPVAAAAAFTP